MSYTALGADPVSAGCQLPYSVQSGKAYSRAFLERMSLKSSLRSSYVPSVSAQKQIDIWLAAGLDPYVPVSVGVAQSRLKCGEIAPGAFDRGMANKATITKMLSDNEALRVSDSILNDVAREIFSRNQFSDNDVAKLSSAIAAAKLRVSVVAPAPVAAPMPMISIKAVESDLNLTTALLNKTAPVNSPAIAYSAPAKTPEPVPYYSPPLIPTDSAKWRTVPETAPGAGKSLIIGAAIALIFLLGKSGKK